MPWTIKDVDSKIKGLNSSQKAAWVSIANAALANCKSKGDSDCEGRAVRIANAKAKTIKNSNETVVELFKSKRIKWKDIKTVESEEGLLVKGIPVFKTGMHRNKKYDEKYIDKNMIGQFDPEDDIPLQADHSDSWNSTLGWVKKLYRKGKLLLADLMLVEDNAVARWQKGLMKKWSVSINRETGKLHEISAVAFPYVKEAAIHGDVAEVGMKDYEVEETEIGKKPPKREIIEIDAHAENDHQPAQIYDEHGEPLSISITPKKVEKEEVKEEKKEDDKEEHDENIETIDWADGIDVSISSKGTPKTTFLTVNGKKIKGATDVSFSMYGSTVSVRYTKTKNSSDGVVESQSYEYRTPYTDRPVYGEDLTASSQALSDSSDDKARDNKASDEHDPAKEHVGLANDNEDTETNTMSDEKKTDVQESSLLKEAMEKEVKLSSDIKEKDTKLAKMSDDVKAKELEIAQFKVDKELADLKAAGKVLPAQEEGMKELMLGLSEENRGKFIEVLNAGKPKVDLDEHSSQESKKDEDSKVDLESMSAEEIEANIEKYAKDNGVPVDDARDIYYEKNSKK